LVRTFSNIEQEAKCHQQGQDNETPSGGVRFEACCRGKRPDERGVEVLAVEKIHHHQFLFVGGAPRIGAHSPAGAIRQLMLIS
jgi:hypothetical protein